MAQPKLDSANRKPQKIRNGMAIRRRPGVDGIAAARIFESLFIINSGITAIGSDATERCGRGHTDSGRVAEGVTFSGHPKGEY